MVGLHKVYRYLLIAKLEGAIFAAATLLSAILARNTPHSKQK